MTIERPMFPPVDPTRRRFLTVAAAGAMSITAVSATALPLEVDTELVHAARDLEATDQAIDSLHRKYDDADSREDYRAIEDRRNENIATLVTIRAKSAAGIQAKAASLRLRAMIEDYTQHQQIAVSLADDLVGGIPLAALPIAAAAPAAAAQTLDAELIELGARFEPLVDRYTSLKGDGPPRWRKPTPSMIENLAIQQTGTTSIRQRSLRHSRIVASARAPTKQTMRFLRSTRK
jgi:hypothetical protein